MLTVCAIIRDRFPRRNSRGFFLSAIELDNLETFLTQTFPLNKMLDALILVRAKNFYCKETFI